MRIELRYSSGVYQVRERSQGDVTPWINTSWITISDEPHTLEIDLRAAASAGSNDGSMTFWIDGVQQTEITGLDNDQLSIEKVHLGVCGGNLGGLNGAFYFDDFVSRRSTYIGLRQDGGLQLGAAPQPIPAPPSPAQRNPLAAPLPAMFAAPQSRANPAPPAQSGEITVAYTYNGDGQRVMSSNGATGITTVYIGNYFEWNVQAGTMTQYYYAGAERIAMRSGNGSGTAGLVWIVGDHLGSTSFTVNAATGLKQSERRYKPWGELRYSEGETGTKYGFTGQMAEVDKLYFFGARFYDSYTGRWTQPDSLIPNPYNSLDWDRYQFVRSNPLKFTDPSGHRPCDLGLDEECDHGTWQPPVIQRYRDQLRDRFGWRVEKQWTEQQLFLLLQLSYAAERAVSKIPGDANTYNTVAIVLDIIAWMTDLYSVGAVIFGGIFGAGIPAALLPAGIPEVPVVTGISGILIAELSVQGVINIGNVLASLATASAIISDIKNGNIQPTMDTMNSITFTGMGWASNEAFLSFTIQSLALVNDFGWASFPFSSR